MKNVSDNSKKSKNIVQISLDPGRRKNVFFKAWTFYRTQAKFLVDRPSSSALLQN